MTHAAITSIIIIISSLINKLINYNSHLHTHIFNQNIRSWRFFLSASVFFWILGLFFCSCIWTIVYCIILAHPFIWHFFFYVKIIEHHYINKLMMISINMFKLWSDCVCWTWNKKNFITIFIHTSIAPPFSHYWLRNRFVSSSSSSSSSSTMNVNYHYSILL